jgi:hypothetical protein
MRVDVFDPVSPSRALLFRTETQTLTVIVDGSGSWGSGREAADRTRDALADRWRDARNWSLDSLAEDLSTAASSTPNELRDSEFGWSFSATCLLATENLIECVAAGFYRVDVCAPSGMATLFRPEMLLDQLVADGTLSPQAAAVFPHRHVCLGPFIGDKDDVTLSRARHVVAPDEAVIVTHAGRYDLSELRVPQSAEALSALAISDAFPSPVVIARP